MWGPNLLYKEVFLIPIVYSWEQSTYVGVGLVGLVHCKSDIKPDLFCQFFHFPSNLREVHIYIPTELSIMVKNQNSLPGYLGKDSRCFYS